MNSYFIGEKFTHKKLNKMSKLFLIRHGESYYNSLNLFTGTRDVPLTDKGKCEAIRIGSYFKNFRIDVAYTSCLSRAKESLHIILEQSGHLKTLIHINAALNERDYGLLSGRNKSEIEKEYGAEQLKKWRRSFYAAPPEGESLREVFHRVVPFFKNYILNDLRFGKNVLVVAHGNSLRALIKELDEISDTDIENIEVATGEVVCYRIDESGKFLKQKFHQQLNNHKTPAVNHSVMSCFFNNEVNEKQLLKQN